MTIKEALLKRIRLHSDKIAFVTISELNYTVSGFIHMVKDEAKHLVISKRDESIAVIMPYQEYLDKVIDGRKPQPAPENSDE